MQFRGGGYGNFNHGNQGWSEILPRSESQLLLPSNTFQISRVIYIWKDQSSLLLGRGGGDGGNPRENQKRPAYMAFISKSWFKDRGQPTAPSQCHLGLLTPLDQNVVTSTHSFVPRFSYSRNTYLAPSMPRLPVWGADAKRLKHCARLQDAATIAGENRSVVGKIDISEQSPQHVCNFNDGCKKRKDRALWECRTELVCGWHTQEWVRVGKEQISSWGNTPCAGLERKRSLEHEKYWGGGLLEPRALWGEVGQMGLGCWGGGGGATANKALRILDCIVQAIRNHWNNF